MSVRTRALQELAGFFERHRLRYMVIGGLANTVWGRPRATYDADVKVILGGMSIVEYVERWLEEFAAGLERPDTLARYRQSRALLGL